MIEWFKAQFGKKAETKLPTEVRFKQLWKSLVPLSGEADTLQGEIVRAVGRLDDEYNRNGNVNWEPGDYHSEFVKFLKHYLADGKTFDSQTVQRIKTAAEQIRLAAEDLDTETDGDEKVKVQKHSADTELEYLIECAVEWCEKNPKPVYRPAGQDYWTAPE